MSTQGSKAALPRIVLRCALVGLLGSIGTQAMAAKDCWGDGGALGGIQRFYDYSLTFLCWNPPSGFVSAIISAANEKGKVPFDYGEYTQTSSFQAGQCAPLSGFSRPRWDINQPAVRCKYTETRTAVFYDKRRPDVVSTLDGTIDVVQACGQYNNMSPIGSTRDSCKYIVDRYSTPAANSCGVGNPLDPLTGIKRQPEALLSWGRGHSLSMMYVGTLPPMDRDLNEGGAQSFGRRWFSNLHRQGVSQYLGGNVLQFQRGNGVWKRFGQYAGSDDPSQRAPMPKAGDDAPYNWSYRDLQSGAIETYTWGDMRLLSIAYIDGRRLDFTGSIHPAGAGQIDDRYLIDSVRDESGRVVSFQYGSVDDHYSGITAITDPANAQLQIAYDERGNLTRITYPDLKSKQFLYEDAAFPIFLTGRIDEGDGRIGTYRYDASGRAIETQTGSLPPWKIRWINNPPDPRPVEYYDPELDKIIRIHPLSLPQPTQAEVTAPDGTRSIWDGTAVGRSALVGARSQPAGAGCAASTSGAAFDAAGNAVQSDDFNGNRTCKTFDPARNLELTRVEGLPTATACSAVTATSLPAGARMVSSQWHSDWRVSTRTAEPRRITTLVYNGQPDPYNGNAVASCAPADARLPDGKPIVVLCKRVEQATTDETGAEGFGAILQSGVAARSTTWTYNATGQVLTETDPRNRVVLTNEYYADTTADHTKGDLKSSKNAAGHTTTFARYDAYGKPLEVVDANTRTTTYAYDPRQRLTSVTTGGSTTTYEYWPTGLLKKTSQADGGEVNYEYDDAHRLVAVSDTRGNRIVYALDANGNRTQESAKDPQGALKRTMSRAFDALGRAQQTTGRD